MKGIRQQMKKTEMNKNGTGADGFRQLTIWDVIQQYEHPTYSVKSLFAGCGGLDYGLQQAGLEVVESYEFEANACATLAQAGKGAVYKCDISKLLLNNQLRTFAISASFPCTHFSTAGLRDGDELYLEAHRLIFSLRPEIFVIENVPAMARYKVVMEAFMKMPGYCVSKFILNAADCGAPQNRKRLIIIGSKKPFLWNFSPLPPEERTYLIDILEGGVDEPLPKGILNRLNGVNHGQWPARIKDPMVDDYAATCVAHYAKDQGDQLVLDPINGRPRPYTVTEYARLQGFPDDYPFAKGKAATLKQIGNAVSPYMARMIGKEIMRYVEMTRPDMNLYNDVHYTRVRKVILQ